MIGVRMMEQQTIIYLGRPGLQAQILASYLAKLDVSFQCACMRSDVLAIACRVRQPVIVLDLGVPTNAITRLVDRIIQAISPIGMHVYILDHSDSLNVQADMVTVISGTCKLTQLVQNIRSLARQRTTILK